MKLVVKKSNLVSASGNINLVGECVTRCDINECYNEMQRARSNLWYRRAIHLIVYCLMLVAILTLGILTVAMVSGKSTLGSIGIACCISLCFYISACVVYLSKTDDAAVSLNLEECQKELEKVEEIWGAYVFFTGLSEGDVVSLRKVDKNGFVLNWHGNNFELKLFDAISGVIRKSEDKGVYTLENVVIDFSVARTILTSIKEKLSVSVGLGRRSKCNVHNENVWEGRA